jgi:hypothetical protein
MKGKVLVRQKAATGREKSRSFDPQIMRPLFILKRAPQDNVTPNQLST